MTMEGLIALYEARICPACGFELEREAWSGRGRYSSDQICLCCHFQFGYTDATLYGDFTERIEIYLAHRQQWIEEGMKWRGIKTEPKGWDPQQQLSRLRKIGKTA
jgi:hypothetical protein